jgi:hypothetical protein
LPRRQKITEPELAKQQIHSGIWVKALRRENTKRESRKVRSQKLGWSFLESK